MKKFIVNCGVFLFVILIVFTSIEVALLYVPNTYSYKREYLEKHLNEIEILLLGNSYIEESVRPDIIGNNCFNLAISGRDIIFDSEIVGRYFSLMKKLRVVVMPLDYSKFEFGRGKKNPMDTRKNLDGMTDTYRCMHYKYMGLHVGGFLYWSEILNSQLNYMSRFCQPREGSVECDSLGYIKLVLSKRNKGWENRALPPIIDTSLAIDTCAYDYYYQNFLKIARCCQQSYITLLIINTPKSESYKKEINAVVMKEISLFVENIQHTYSCTKYQDYTYDDDFVPDDFYDACHLTDCGAIKLSEKLRLLINN